MKPNFNRYQPAALEIYEKAVPDPKKDPDKFDEWLFKHTERCILGYEPVKGDYIPGDYYFHLNFVYGEIFDEASNDKRIGKFMYNDCDHELQNFLWQCEQDRIGALTMKGRRARFTTTMSSKILARYTFFPGTSLGVGAYGDDYVQKVRSMINVSRAHLPIYLSSSTLSDTSKLLESGGKTNTDIGAQKEGTFSKIYYRNFGGTKSAVGAFRSLSLKMLLFDEIGENPHLLECISASEECWKDGANTYGLPVLGGTSNMMKNPSKDLSQIVEQPEKYGFRLHIIPRQRFYYKTGYDFCDLKNGTASAEQQERARLYLKQIGDEKYTLENKTAYYSHLQENPTTLEEMFMGNSASALLPLDKINAQIKVLNDWDSLKSRIIRWNIHWKNRKYNPYKPEVEWELHPEGEYHVLEMPDPKYKDMDIGGIDTYYRSGAPNSDSIGVMYMFRRENLFDLSALSHAPIVEYAIRYPTNERFYDGCLKLSVAYSHPGSPAKMLSEFDATFLLWMEKANALRFFKEKAVAISGSYSNSGNTFMTAMSGSAKAHGTRLLQDYFNDYSQNIGFLNLLEDAKKFGIFNTDHVMAMMECLIHDKDNMNITIKKVEPSESGIEFFPSFDRTSNGILVPNSQNYSHNTSIDFLKPF